MMHTTFEMAQRTPAIVKYPLCFIVSYVQPVTQQYESRAVQKASLQPTHTKRKGWCHAPQLYKLLSKK